MLVHPISERIDNAVDSVMPLGRIDMIRMARMEAVRALVLGRLNDLQAVEMPLPQVMWRAEFDMMRPSMTSPLFFFASAPIDYIVMTEADCAGPDPRIIEERKFLRRLLRLLNKAITIALRWEALERSLQRIVLRLRSFFITHGNHPPRFSLRYLTLSGGRAV